ncbi:MAG TPA: glycosyltransferase family 4 protein [Verrucomicrobiae bacterium]|jgi:glycosyltransferase involved in cell wall biosynthesis|nr:glycosyltransferase family 4 protein [Verrucomicrobiae bacterium]
MKIAQITSVYLPVPPRTHGGTERIVYYLCRDLYRRGHAVELFASGDSKVDCPLHSVLPVASLDDPESTIYLEKEFETRNAYNLYRQGERFDIIHAHWPTLAAYFSSYTKTPTVLTYAYIEKELHDYYRETFPNCFPVCVSRAQTRMLGDESLPVVYNGIDVGAIPFNDAPEDFFLIVGRMTPGKGIAEAIRIAEKAQVRLVIVGAVTKHLPWSENYFLKEVKPHIDGDRIRHIESLTYDELMRWMGRAKAFLFPLQWDEPFGMVVAESMAAGAPVLAYPRGSMPELIQDGETGLLPGDESGMIEAVRAVDTLDRRRCRRWVQERFSVEQMIDGYEALYRRISNA